jgi:hypothetical protein
MSSIAQWPGNSGYNAMRMGECTAGDTFTYIQWPDCDCSGDIGAIKQVPFGAGKCVVDNPNNLCSKVIDYSACQTKKNEDESPVVAIE